MNITYALARSISLISYCFIILNGSMIGIPFIVYLFAALLDFGTASQIAAILSITGLVLLIIPLNLATKQKILVQILIYFLLLSSIVERLLTIPLHLFNYPLFLIPVSLFALLFPLSIWMMCEITKQKNAPQ